MSWQTLLQIFVGFPLLALGLAVIARAVRELVHGPSHDRLIRRKARGNW